MLHRDVKDLQHLPARVSRRESIYSCIVCHGVVPENDLLARSKKLLLERIYARSEGLDRGARVFREACIRTFTLPSLQENRRQIAVSIEKQVFGSFLRELENQVCPPEQKRVHHWLEQYTDVQVDTMLWTDKIFRPPCSGGQELHDRAQQVLDHIREMDHRIIVARFPAAVCITLRRAKANRRLHDWQMITHSTRSLLCSVIGWDWLLARPQTCTAP